MKDKIDYTRNRVQSGYSPHKLLEMEIEKCLNKKNTEDLFSIDKIKWKGLDK